MKVRIVPTLPPGEYLPGIGADGADVPADVAEDLIARGLVKKVPPKKSGDVRPSSAKDDDANVLLAGAEGAA